MTLPRLDTFAFQHELNTATCALYEILEVTTAGYVAKMNLLRATVNNAPDMAPAELAHALQEHAQALALTRDLFVMADARTEKIVDLCMDAALKLKLEASQESPE